MHTLSMIFKLAEAAEKSWRRLDGHNQLSKVIHGSDRKLKPLPPDPVRHQVSAIAPPNLESLISELCGLSSLRGHEVFERCRRTTFWKATDPRASRQWDKPARIRHSASVRMSMGPSATGHNRYPARATRRIGLSEA
jgi:hypothetical protein